MKKPNINVSKWENIVHVARLDAADLYCIWNEIRNWTWYKEYDELQECGHPHWTAQIGDPV